MEKSIPKSLVFGLFLLALFFSLPSSLIYINQPWSQIFPSAIKVFLFGLPFIVMYALKISQEQDSVDERRSLVNQQKKEELKKQLRFHTRYRPTADGEKSEWQIRNKGTKAWERAILIIECIEDGQKKVEKHQIPYLEPDQPLTFESQLKIVPGACWRTMVLTEFSYRVDLADKWVDSHRWVKKQKQLSKQIS